LKTRANILFVFLVTWGVACAQSVPSGSPLEELDAVLAEFVKASRTPGIAMTIRDDTGLIYSGSAGYANLESANFVDPATTMFRIGSTSKALTSYAAALLHERGQLDIDAPIQTYVPSFPEKQNGETTVRLLAGHLAGIRHYQDGELGFDVQYDSVLEALTIFAADPLVAVPGDSFNYSSYGWNLISAAVEAASGMPFLAFMEEEVFAPFGMRHTTADQVKDVIPGRTGFYYIDPESDRVVNGPHVNSSYKWGGAGYLSSSEDLARFGRALLDESVLSEASRELLWTSMTTRDGASTGYGFGWFVAEQDGRVWVEHPGGIVGGAALLRIYPNEGTVMAIVANLSFSPIEELATEVIELISP
jgi:serine beta-lactamase-like protein LACTB, mitochondrial